MLLTFLPTASAATMARPARARPLATVAALKASAVQKARTVPPAANFHMELAIAPLAVSLSMAPAARMARLARDLVSVNAVRPTTFADQAKTSVKPVASHLLALVLPALEVSLLTDPAERTERPAKGRVLVIAAVPADIVVEQVPSVVRVARHHLAHAMLDPAASPLTVPAARTARPARDQVSVIAAAALALVVEQVPSAVQVARHLLAHAMLVPVASLPMALAVRMARRARVLHSVTVAAALALVVRPRTIAPQVASRTMVLATPDLVAFLQIAFAVPRTARYARVRSLVIAVVAVITVAVRQPIAVLDAKELTVFALLVQEASRLMAPAVKTGRRARAHHLVIVAVAVGTVARLQPFAELGGK